MVPGLSASPCPSSRVGAGHIPIGTRVAVSALALGSNSRGLTPHRYSRAFEPRARLSSAVEGNLIRVNHAGGALVLDPQRKSVNPIDTHRRAGALVISAPVDCDSDDLRSTLDQGRGARICSRVVGTSADPVPRVVMLAISLPDGGIAKLNHDRGVSGVRWRSQRKSGERRNSSNKHGLPREAMHDVLPKSEVN